MTYKQKNLIIIASLVLLSFLLTTPLTRITNFGSKYNQPISKDHIIDADELNDFLIMWAKFMRSDLEKNMRHISLSQEDKISPQVERWIEVHGWSAKRFWEIEQKVMNLVAIAKLINNLEDNKKFLNNAPNISAENLKTIIKNQETQLKNATYNPKELELVQANLYAVAQVLEGKAVIKK